MLYPILTVLMYAGFICTGITECRFDQRFLGGQKYFPLSFLGSYRFTFIEADRQQFSPTGDTVVFDRGPFVSMFKLIVLLATLLVASAARKNELVLLGDEKIGEALKTPVMYKPRASLPASLDYRAVGLLTTDLNQHIPVYWYVVRLRLGGFVSYGIQLL
jgi:hypothetical protein